MKRQLLITSLMVISIISLALLMECMFARAVSHSDTTKQNLVKACVIVEASLRKWQNKRHRKCPKLRVTSVIALKKEVSNSPPLFF